jgi:ACS family hexuronate transporter-like MFS transporter
VALAYAWRIAFFAIGAVGLVWIAFWRHWVTDRPCENPRVSEAEFRRVEVNRAISDAAVDHQSTPLRAYLLRPSVLSVGLGMFAGNYALYIFLSWLPSYLIAALHLSVQQMSYVVAIPWACGFVGYIGGGALADLVYRRSSDRLRARKLATSIPLALALIAIDLAPYALTAVTSIALAVMLLTSSMQSCWATVHELVPESRVGGVGGFVHVLSNVSGVIGPTATGFAVQYLGGYGGMFVVAATIATGGALRWCCS